MKIGIIGAENSHTAAIARTLNIDKAIRGVSVDFVWGETEEFACKAAESGHIPKIVKLPSEMYGKIDGLIVDHRHAKQHLGAARPFVKRGIPVFIDKPFCFEAEKGKEFLKAAKAAGVSVTSFSTVPHQKTFLKFKRKLADIGRVVSGSTCGPCDLRSKYGGIFFYGIHQADMALKAFGYNVNRVLVTKNGNGATGQLLYSDGKIVTLNLIKSGAPGFAISAAAEGGAVHERIRFDANAYISGIKVFVNMFRTGEDPESAEHMLRPVQVLEALEKSLKSGAVERVTR